MSGKMPDHVKAIRRGGRTYYYFKSAPRADGGYDLVRLPDIGLVQFQHEYDAALAARKGLPPPEWKRPDRTYVYFIGGEVGAIKIGWARNPLLRLPGIQTGSPIPLAILATVEGGRKLERAYHAKFAAHRLHGEWFERHPDILAEIDRLNGSAG